MATLVGLLINYIGIDPMKALVYAAVINGVVAVPLLYIVAKIAGDKMIMGKFVSGALSKILVWATVVVMAVGVGIMAWLMWT